MTLTRDEVTNGELAALDAFAALVRDLDAAALDTPTRCAGWTVRDVAAHVAGTITAVGAGQVAGLGTAEVIDGHVAERRGRTAAELADEIAGGRKIAADLLAALDDTAWNTALPGFDGTIGEGVETIWYDAYVHADDIRTALGLAPVRTADDLHASVHHVAAALAKRGWGPATLAFDGLHEVHVGDGGPRVTGDALDFVRAATGRTDPSALGLDASVNIYAE
jgi:uncharacterized protein (TIGR03083 family)